MRGFFTWIGARKVDDSYIDSDTTSRVGMINLLTLFKNSLFDKLDEVTFFVMMICDFNLKAIYFILINISLRRSV